MGHVTNTKIANILFEIADLLELKGVSFKPRAYRRAAQNINSLADDIETYYKKGEIEKISGVGESISLKIKEILENGKLKYLEDLRKEFPEGLVELMKIQGLGPQRLMDLYKELGISNVDQLKSAAKDKKIRNLEGFGKKTEENILKGIKMYEESKKRFLLGDILPIAEEILDKLNTLKEVQKIEIAGSIRRKKETIGDVDILVVSSEPDEVMDYFTGMSEVERILSKGRTKSSIIAENNLQVDLRVIDKSSFGSALQYFTGSKEHNIKLRKIALDQNWKLSEYALRDNKNNKKIAGEKEAEIYEALGLAYIEPELREDRGEIEAAKNNTLPDLIKLSDIRGDLHIHTNWSEGSHSIKEMAKEASNLGYEYIAICDHSKTLQIAHGLDEDDYKNQMKEIEKINEELDTIEILSGAEVNIDSKGKIDLNNEILKDLDFVVASIHSGFKQSKEKITKRLINAMDNDYINAIGHPTGRIINKRASYDLDVPKIFEKASELDIFMELNSLPERLDLSDVNCKKAKEYDLKIVINTDSHNKNNLRYMKLGVATARRGWLEKEKVINTLILSDLKKKLNL